MPRARKAGPRRRLPSATYRVQLTPSFGFRDAARALDYLDALGVTDLYVSPILRSRSGSHHGYDVIDPRRLDPELGGRGGFGRLARALASNEMGLLVDLVPNHMAIGPENPWWMDLLRHGARADAARIFDVDLSEPGARVLVPVLGEPYEDALASGDLRLARDRRGRFVVRYHEHAFPVSPATMRLIRRHGTVAESLAAFERDPVLLDELLEAQHYRLVFWREANERINYRRFFDVSDLAAMRVEDPIVFDRTHELILELVARDEVTGLRLDHIDGLLDPLGYLRRLHDAGVGYVVVEKILGPGETLPPDWPVAGTTGYEATNLLNGLFVAPRGLSELGEAYHSRGGPTRFEAVLLEAKLTVLRELLAADVSRIVRAMRRALPPVDDDALREAIVEISARLPVYRTYGRGSSLSDRDRRLVERAVRDAEGLDPRARRFVRRILLRREPEAIEAADRWQQLTGPAMAKGFEDTALYRYNRLVSCNEVGGEPDPGAVTVEAFHRAMGARAPGGLTTTSTHDTKRSEDVRARIDVLSEIPGVFIEACARWRRLTDVHRPALGIPDPDEEWLLYQTLLGVWPYDPDEHKDLPRRVGDYMIKAAREAKRRTSWIDPDVEHEEGLLSFVEAILDDEAFRSEVSELVDRIAWPGAINALAQTLLKVCVPGVPDVYQGTELWDLSLVDPDNRRPVDLAERARLLAAIDRARDYAALLTELLDTWEDGRIKLYVLSRALRFRREQRALFERGAFVPLRVSGSRAEHLVAFARRRARAWALCVVPRFPETFDPLRGDWEDTVVVLPAGAPGSWTGVLSGVEVEASKRALPVGEVLAELPVALLRA